jgi:ABC-type cobalamin/Fe3+-siderophores transport system ATPase subunit
MKKLLLVLLLLLGAMAVEARPNKYRIAVKQIEGKLYYIPQERKKIKGLAVPQWVDLSNQPLRSQNEAMNIVKEAQIIEHQIKQSNIIQYINIII